jgi:hypothetical protein
MMGILDGYKTPYEALKALQRAVREEQGRKPPITDLIVLSQQNDPFYAGTETEKAMAEWFAEVFGTSTGSHLRRIHYRLVSRGDVMRADGVLYENDKSSWTYLNNASRFARYLGLMDPEDIVDRRNPSPHIYMAPGLGLRPEWSYEVDTNRLDRINTYLGSSYFEPVEVETEVSGYLYEESLQPYHVEVWAEKTTMNDILVPLCRTLGANYVSGAGYQSITAMVSLLRDRVARLEKPCRVLYISDYDAAGRNMPKQMARHMEFWSERYGTDYDIRVEPIVMTAEQARDYPAAPDSGAVELDAMEELDPGLLARIVRENVAQFRDFDLSHKVHENAREAQRVVDEAVEEAIAEELAAVEEVKGEAEEIYERYRARLEELAGELEEELEPLDNRLETLQQAVREKLKALEPDLPPLPEGELEEPEDYGWLFDSRRDYREQLVYYNDR